MYVDHQYVWRCCTFGILLVITIKILQHEMLNINKDVFVLVKILGMCHGGGDLYGSTGFGEFYLL